MRYANADAETINYRRTLMARYPILKSLRKDVAFKIATDLYEKRETLTALGCSTLIEEGLRTYNS